MRSTEVMSREELELVEKELRELAQQMQAIRDQPELMRLGKLGDNPHIFFEAVDRFSRDGYSCLDILAEFEEWNVTPHFAYDNPISAEEVVRWQNRRTFQTVDLAELPAKAGLEVSI